MNSLFQSLFKKYKVDSFQIDPLSNKSPLSAQPSGTLFSLWQHQLAMLYRCQQIETQNKKVKVNPTNAERYSNKQKPKVLEYALGIMNDPPGCGKTHVMLSILHLDKKQTAPNLVIVPPNLYQQWVSAINSFFPSDTFKWKGISTYSDTMFFNQLSNTHVKNTRKTFNDTRLFVITTEFSDIIAGALVHHESGDPMFKFNRVILDEIDTVNSMVVNIPSCERVWFISASFDPYNHKQIGPFDLQHMQKDEIFGLVCRCDPEFMKEHQDELIEPDTKLIKVKDDDICLFKEVLLPGELKLLNTCNLKKLKHQLLYRKDVDVFDLKALVFNMIQQLEYKLDNNIVEDTEAIITQDMVSKYKKISNYLDVVDSSWLNKMDYINDIVKQIAASSEKEKWIFFSEDDDFFDTIEEVLDLHLVKYVNMRSGTFDKNRKAIQDYKTDPDVRVICLNSMKDGCGLNLENTTHILFLHNVDCRLHEQVVGRAQRPGRKSRLNIVCLYNTNEIPLTEQESHS